MFVIYSVLINCNNFLTVGWCLSLRFWQCVPLGYDTMSLGNWLLTFWDGVVVSSSRRINYPAMWCRNQEQIPQNDVLRVNVCTFTSESSVTWSVTYVLYLLKYLFHWDVYLMRQLPMLMWYVKINCQNISCFHHHMKCNCHRVCIDCSTSNDK